MSLAVGAPRVPARGLTLGKPRPGSWPRGPVARCTSPPHTRCWTTCSTCSNGPVSAGSSAGSGSTSERNRHPRRPADCRRPRPARGHAGPSPLPSPVRELMRRNHTVDVHDAGGRVVGGSNPGRELRQSLLT